MYLAAELLQGGKSRVVVPVPCKDVQGCTFGEVQEGLRCGSGAALAQLPRGWWGYHPWRFSRTMGCGTEGCGHDHGGVGWG